jgi:hypothetical protein
VRHSINFRGDLRVVKTAACWERLTMEGSLYLWSARLCRLAPGFQRSRDLSALASACEEAARQW